MNTLEYMTRYGERVKYLDKIEFALVRCSVEHGTCNSCPVLKKCSRAFSNLCESKKFKAELSAWKTRDKEKKKGSMATGEIHIRLPDNNIVGFGIS